MRPKDRIRRPEARTVQIYTERSGYISTRGPGDLEKCSYTGSQLMSDEVADSEWTDCGSNVTATVL